MIINAENLILGRLASYVAKKALLGEKVDIVNCEKIVITGTKRAIQEEYKRRVERGDTFKGPFISRMPDRLVKRSIRTMLPYKKYRGKKALKNIKCYMGVPDNLKDQKQETLDQFHVSKTKSTKYLRIKDISKFLGKNVC